MFIWWNIQNCRCNATQYFTDIRRNNGRKIITPHIKNILGKQYNVVMLVCVLLILTLLVCWVELFAKKNPKNVKEDLKFTSCLEKLLNFSSPLLGALMNVFLKESIDVANLFLLFRLISGSNRHIKKRFDFSFPSVHVNLTFQCITSQNGLTLYKNLCNKWCKNFKECLTINKCFNNLEVYLPILRSYALNG